VLLGIKKPGGILIKAAGGSWVPVTTDDAETVDDVSTITEGTRSDASLTLCSSDALWLADVEVLVKDVDGVCEGATDECIGVAGDLNGED
jgi:hypothetical protein